MDKYFVEFEFQSILGDIYWFPLLINAEKEESNEYVDNIKKALEEHYKVLKIKGPQLILEGLNSNSINDYVAERCQGRMKILNVRFWKFINIEPISNLTFNEFINFIENNYDIGDIDIYANGCDINFPVRLLTQKSLNDFDEYLLINIIKKGGVTEKLSES